MISSSSIEPIYYILPLIGLIIGFFGSLIGGGGGFFFLPVLTLVVGAPIHAAVLTALVAALPVSAVGAAAYYRRGCVDLPRGAVFMVAGIIGAFAGAYLASLLSARPLKIGFGIYAFIMAGHLVYVTRKKGGAVDNRTVGSLDSPRAHSVSHKTKGSLFGFAAGMITGTFGTSGTAPVLAGLFSLNLPTKVVIGTSLMVTLVNTVFAVGAHVLVGQIDLTLLAFLTSGSIVGALWGPRVLTHLKTKHTDHPRVRYVYAAGMVVIGLLMILS